MKLKFSLDWLLIFVPVAVAMKYVPALHNDLWLFFCSCIAIIPVAGLMGRATEHLAERVGSGVGGLLNATFGNAAELIIALMALQKGLTDVVKASITGSIIGNILLVFGLSALVGSNTRNSASIVLPRKQPPLRYFSRNRFTNSECLPLLRQFESRDVDARPRAEALPGDLRGLVRHLLLHSVFLAAYPQEIVRGHS